MRSERQGMKGFTTSPFVYPTVLSTESAAERDARDIAAVAVAAAAAAIVAAAILASRERAAAGGAKERKREKTEG
ncbi:unnamed protein product [Acanthocheilonema viteae]|uniref:Uncharacterized protein n=1 Tax=Acanthocheilonema viteae TaxID=6277 RepID=A0A498S9X0_ACAVI|nr:unnamed protein product [Acanthocheilonema viteae]